MEIIEDIFVGKNIIFMLVVNFLVKFVFIVCFVDGFCIGWKYKEY